MVNMKNLIYKNVHFVFMKDVLPLDDDVCKRFSRKTFILSRISNLALMERVLCFRLTGGIMYEHKQ